MQQKPRLTAHYGERKYTVGHLVSLSLVPLVSVEFTPADFG